MVPLTGYFCEALSNIRASSGVSTVERRTSQQKTAVSSGTDHKAPEHRLIPSGLRDHYFQLCLNSQSFRGGVKSNVECSEASTLATVSPILILYFPLNFSGPFFLFFFFLSSTSLLHPRPETPHTIGKGSSMICHISNGTESYFNRPLLKIRRRVLSWISVGVCISTTPLRVVVQPWAEESGSVLSVFQL